MLLMHTVLLASNLRSSIWMFRIWYTTCQTVRVCKRRSLMLLSLWKDLSIRQNKNGSTLCLLQYRRRSGTGEAESIEWFIEDQAFSLSYDLAVMLFANPLRCLAYKNRAQELSFADVLHIPTDYATVPKCTLHSTCTECVSINSAQRQVLYSRTTRECRYWKFCCRRKYLLVLCICQEPIVKEKFHPKERAWEVAKKGDEQLAALSQLFIE